jgi:hypothetical protein
METFAEMSTTTTNRSDDDGAVPSFSRNSESRQEIPACHVSRTCLSEKDLFY